MFFLNTTFNKNVFSPHFHSRSLRSLNSIFWWRCQWCESESLGDLRCRTHWRPPPHQQPAFKHRQTGFILHIVLLLLKGFFILFNKCCLTSTSSLVGLSFIHLTTHVLPLWSPDWITPYTPGSCRAWAEMSSHENGHGLVKQTLYLMG